MFGMSFQEFLVLCVIIALFSMSGLWPVVIRGLRELRGDPVEPPRTPRSAADDEVCFRLLGVSPSAHWDEIERAYRRKAKVHHPDHGGDEDAMRALNEAYNRIKRIHGR
jgi:hypothetical protein